ncbi:MAG TPA: SET domain-containing protein-lysine N-methyltransferase [Xanthomonadaceae bacterium]|nr:SET domain-containing protein-lysine N-methyltransferase [Xanthomonadaceae bacterium]
MDAQLAVLIQPPAVYIKDTGTPRGRGAFAGRAFKLGELVEACPVVLFQPLPDLRLPLQIKRIVFGWGKLVGSPHRRPAIVLGYGSMYNHANPAAMRCEADPANEILRFIAIRDVEADEELTINYNSIGDGKSSEDVWFENNHVTLIDS